MGAGSKGKCTKHHSPGRGTYVPRADRRSSEGPPHPAGVVGGGGGATATAVLAGTERSGMTASRVRNC